MTVRLNIVVLALMLLLSQTAMAAHDIRCLDGEHELTCSVYFAQDHKADNATDHVQIERHVCNEKLGGFVGWDAPSIFNCLYLSRAPPA